jgi:acetyl-CoA/propionyl-CoA carboxylase biotin carboxyl carrier protein
MYDPLIAKLVAWDGDREAATRRMRRALEEYEINGISTLIPFHRAILATEQWANGETCRDLLEDPEWLKNLAPQPATHPAAPGREAEEPAGNDVVARDYKVEVEGKLFEVRVYGPPATGSGSGSSPATRRPPKRERRERAGGGAAGEELVSPLQGTVLRVAVERGAEVEEGALICVIEAMKMENEITAHRSGEVAELNVAEGGSVSSGEVIAVIR